MRSINLFWGDPVDHVNTLTDAMVDITSPQMVEVVVRKDDTVLWVNVNGICVLRVCQIPGPEALTIDLMGKEEGGR